MAKRTFIILVAFNALLVLFISMQRDLSKTEGLEKEFVGKGERLTIVSNVVELNSESVEGGCEIVGPFLDLSLAKQMTRRLRGKNIATNLVEKEDVVSRDYWVLIPPKASEKQALRLLRQLQLANIDSYIVTQGDFANAISLGLFTVKASAYKIKEDMTDAGFNVTVQEILRSQKRFWLKIHGDKSSLEHALRTDLKEFENKTCKVLEI